MQESNLPLRSAVEARTEPLHAEIAQRASELWVEYGRPADRDLAIWLEAEQRLLSATLTARDENRGLVSAPAAPTARARRAALRLATQSTIATDTTQPLRP